MSLDIPFALAVIVLSLSILFDYESSRTSILSKICISYVFVTENEGKKLTNGVVEVNLSADPTCELKLYNSSLRIFDKDRALPYNISSIHHCENFFVREISFSFPLNLSAYQSKKIKVILSSENVSLPSYVNNYSPSSLSNVTVRISPLNCFKAVSYKKAAEINNTEILGTSLSVVIIK